MPLGVAGEEIEPNLRQTYMSELAEKTVDFLAVWPHFSAACESFSQPNLSPEAAKVVRWRIRKFSADLLVTAAQIGRVLDPHPMRGAPAFIAGCKARGKALRRELHVPDNSPLLDKDLRNALEHIDEHIDRWVLENPTRSLNIWAITTTAAGEAPLEHAIRRIHVRTLDVFVLDHRADLGAIHSAVEALRSAMPSVTRSEMTMRFDDPKTGSSDVIALDRVLGANEKPHDSGSPAG